MKLHTLQQNTDADPRFTFWCPACKQAHAVWTTGKVIWTFNGNLDAPTFEPSLLISHSEWTPPVTPENLEQWKAKPWPQTQVEKRCHLHVTDGVLNYCADSTHALAGKSIPMEDF